MSDHPPHLRVVSERSSADIQHEHRLAELRWRLVTLTANLLRVTRGAGRSWEIVTQCIETAHAYHAYVQAIGHLPPSFEIEQILNLKREFGDFSSDADIDCGRSMLVAGALQFTASTLLGQRTQVAAGQREMFEGERLIVQARERQRKERLAEERAARTPRRKTSKKPKAKPKRVKIEL
jgi:hypothetical protein